MTADQPALIGSSGDSLREAFGRSLVSLAEKDQRFVVLDADVAGGTGTHHFREAYPQRFIQVGIAEQNMMSMAAGLARVGLVPFVTTFAVFCLRALEQARLSLAYSCANVKIVASHPGLDVGPDGASAQALEDLAAFRAIPNMVVLSPADAHEVELATAAILAHSGPVYMRSGRSPAPRVLPEDYHFEIGRGQVLHDGGDVTLVACGVQVGRCLQAAKILEQKGVKARVINMASLKPLDHDLLERCAVETGAMVVSEDHNVIGGLGGAVAESLARSRPVPLEFAGVQDCFGESGEPDELAERYGLTPPHLVEAALKVVARKRG